MSKVVLLGLNNPLSERPEMALWPHPAGCTGHRIWRMINLRMPCSPEEYKVGFDRMNILNSREWIPREARLAAPEIWESLRGRTVIILGREGADVLGLDYPDWVLESEQDGVRFRVLPHPSGLNRWYNDHINLNLAAVLLEEMYLVSLGLVG